MNTKHFRGVEIKDADAGEVTAVFATFNTIDSDGDVTRPGAFTDGAAVRISAYGHASWQGALPVGKGVIRSTDTEAILDGQFFLDTQAGRETFEVVKQLSAAGLQEWSYGYDPVEYSYGEHEGQHVRILSRQKVHEVSPVLLGAGVNTRTLTVKSAGGRLVDEAEAVLAAVADLRERAVDVLAKRQEKGKGLGAESAALLERIKAELSELATVLTPEPDPVPDLERELLRFVANTRNLG